MSFRRAMVAIAYSIVCRPMVAELLFVSTVMSKVMRHNSSLNPTLVCMLVSMLGVVLLALLFASGLGSGYILDDSTSVVPVNQLRTRPDLFWQLVFSDTSSPIGRPLTIFSFALEQVVFSAGPEFSKAISIGFHLINATLVAALIHVLLTMRGVRYAYVIAFVTALVWACAPQKVSTVLYISQRMAILSTLFVLMALLSYLLARSASNPSYRLVWSLVCVISVLMAPFAKENGVLAVPLIALLEVFAVPYTRRANGYDKMKVAAVCLMAAGVVFFLIFGLMEYFRSDISYARRNFTYADRLGSSPVILADYFRQFFYPDTLRMGLVHDDYPISSLADGSALAIGATLIWVACLAFMVRAVLVRQVSIVALGIGFFLIGHCIETFYLPLELYFEHRNYLPSVGLAVLFAELMRRVCLRESGELRISALCLAFVYLCSLSLSSYALAAHWRSAEALLLHDVSGHKNSPRVLMDQALADASLGDVAGARELILEAFTQSRSQPAARPMGSADPVLLDVGASCLGGLLAMDELPLAGDLAEDDPIRSYMLRTLRSLVAENACQNFAWHEVSDWLFSFVSVLLDRGYILGLPALVDLYDFEKTLGNPVKAFVYASIARERDHGPLVLLRWAEASLLAGDSESVDVAIVELEAMVDQGKLSGFELVLFKQYKEAIK
ncbi:hypothetical protein R0135_07140 [Congregibacter variabilis]|uniref:Uncharacterized protein n=1 Tax=Congregibacter variabilis TaxID=3081200 RepID=A0ABZ0I7A8_9GAMM|nr:hypothetical protein R0135_07140 [Congregibacter sp. IMCC43200]